MNTIDILTMASPSEYTPETIVRSNSFDDGGLVRATVRVEAQLNRFKKDDRATGPETCERNLESVF